MLAIAFKEWAVICEALAQGKQSLILRKGGIAETAGRFRPDHNTFVLYPTAFHEHRENVKPAAGPLWEAAHQHPVPPGTLRFTHWVEVVAVQQIREFDRVLALEPLHVWSSEVVHQRFQYRTPGLFALVVRVYQLASEVLQAERPEYAGCKSWVQLEAPVDTAGSEPVISDIRFAQILQSFAALTESSPDGIGRATHLEDQ